MALNNTQTATEDPLLSVDNHTTDDPYDFLNNIEAVKQFMPIINAFLSSDESAFNVTVVESDLPEYEHLMAISMLDFNGETLEYAFYYNETLLSEDDDEDDEEAYEESAIDGIMIIDEQTYQLSGVREAEAFEEYLEMKATIDELNFVTIEYGAEQEGNESATEFYYDVIENGVNIQSIEFEIENENQESALSLIFVEGTRESEFSFELEENEDGGRTLEIEFLIEEDGALVDDGEIEAEITFDETTQEYIITYTVQRGDEEDVYEDEYNHDDDNDDDDNDTV